jgi:hypothetical protein
VGGWIIHEVEATDWQDGDQLVIIVAALIIC